MRPSRPLDDVDTKIVAILQQDGRQPNTAIARRLGLAEGTVRNRIARLVEQRILRFGAWTDPLKVGYQTYAIIQIQVDPPKIEQVAERLAELPEIFFLGVSTGPYDIFASALFRSSEHMYEFMTERLTQVPGIQRTLTTHIVRILKREFPSPIPAAPPSTRRAGRADRRRGRGTRRSRPRRS
jgi:Lrp/AsnC family transcriptional regulator for asnA, asnC and gidA